MKCPFKIGRRIFFVCVCVCDYNPGNSIARIFIFFAITICVQVVAELCRQDDCCLMNKGCRNNISLLYCEVHETRLSCCYYLFHVLIDANMPLRGESRSVWTTQAHCTQWCESFDNKISSYSTSRSSFSRFLEACVCVWGGGHAVVSVGGFMNHPQRWEGPFW